MTQIEQQEWDNMSSGNGDPVAEYEKQLALKRQQDLEAGLNKLPDLMSSGNGDPVAEYEKQLALKRQQDLEAGLNKLPDLHQTNINTNKSEHADLFGVGGAGLNLSGNLLAAGIMGTARQTERRREAETDEAIYKNRSDRERIMSMSPEATRQAKASELMNAQANSLNSAANIGASNASGMSGDIDSALLAGIKASAPMAQTGAQYAQQLAEGHKQAYGENEAKNTALGQNTGQLAQLGELTHYTTYMDPGKEALASVAANGVNLLKTGSIAGRDIKDATTNPEYNIEAQRRKDAAAKGVTP